MAVAEQKARLPARNGTPSDSDRDPDEDSPLLLNVNGEAEGDAPAAPECTHDVEFQGLPWWKTPSIWWLIPGFFTYALAFGGIIVPRLNLALTLICREYLNKQASLHPEMTFLPVVMFENNPQCRIPEVQKLGTQFQLYISLTVGILCALSSPKLGALSDRYGRNYLLCLTIFGGCCNEIITILCATYPDTIRYPWLLLGAFFDGACGSFIGAMAITHSYATDCTPPARRGVAFGYLHACLFGGIAVGPFLAALMTKWFGTLMSVFWMALFLHLGFLLYLAFIVPESLSRKKKVLAKQTHAENQEEQEDMTLWEQMHPKTLLKPLSVLCPTGASNAARKKNLVTLAFVTFLIFGVNVGSGPVTVYYVGFAFGWGDYETQMFVGWTSATRVFALVAVLPLLNYLFRTLPNKRARKAGGAVAKPKASGSDNLDLNTIRVALLIDVVQYIVFSYFRSGSIFFLAGLFGSLAGVSSPILNSALSKHVKQGRQGELMGAIGLLHGLGRVVCPTIFNLVYARTVEWWPRFVFVVLTVCFVAGFVVSLFAKPNVCLPDDGAPQSTNDADTESRAEGERERRYRDEELRADELEDEDFART